MRTTEKKVGWGRWVEGCQRDKQRGEVLGKIEDGKGEIWG